MQFLVLKHFAVLFAHILIEHRKQGSVFMDGRRDYTYYPTLYCIIFVASCSGMYGIAIYVGIRRYMYVRSFLISILFCFCTSSFPSRCLNDHFGLIYTSELKILRMEMI